MVKARAHLRFQLKDVPYMMGRFSVVDVFSGEPTVFEGRLLIWLSAEVAEYMVHLLNDLDLKKRGLWD